MQHVRSGAGRSLRRALRYNALMLRANRRHRLLYLALAAMDVATGLPFVLYTLGTPAAGAPLPVTPLPAFALFWGVAVFFMAAADWLNARRWESATRLSALIGIVLATSAALLALLLGRGELAPAALAGAPTRPLILLGWLLFLWWRVAALTSRDLTFFAVGVSFRFGMLVAVAGASLLAFSRPQAPADGITCLFLFFAAGLSAVALARIDDKAFLAEGRWGALLPWPRLAQLLGAVAATLGLAALGAWLWSPRSLGAFFGWLSPVGRALGLVAGLLLYAFVWLLTPVLNWIERMLRQIPVREAAQPQSPLGPLEAGDFTTVGGLLSQFPALRWIFLGLGAVLALGLILLFFARTLSVVRRAAPEEAAPAEPEMAPIEAARGARRGLLGLARRYGLSRRLLAAISVQNLYANTTRLAHRRGFPRPPATPPDRFLPTLARAFPGHDDALRRLTESYMRVHYGDLPATPDELAALRADYRALMARGHE